MLGKKNGVRVQGLTTDAMFGIMVCQSVFQDKGIDCIITSACDSKHGNHSHHYKGCAWDLRTRHLKEHLVTAEEMGGSLREALGSDYQVVVESDHIHCEFDPA